MHLPEQLTVVDSAYLLDGGSIWLRLLDGKGGVHEVFLGQRNIPVFPEGSYLPGRLYFDKALIAVRYSEEAVLLKALKSAKIAVKDEGAQPPEAPEKGATVIVGEGIQAYYDKIAEGPAAATQHLVIQLVGFVESADYEAG